MPKASSLLLVWLAAVAAAQQRPEEKPANLEGIVTHALTGAPVLRAHVMCSGFIGGFAGGKMQQFGAMTDAEGKFSIKGLAAGTYNISVERVGFVMPVENGRQGSHVTLRPDSTSEVKLKLTPTGAILGRVLDPDGNPAEGIGVYAEGAAGNRAMSATTDHKGQYRIGGLAPGRYRVRAERMGLQFPPEIRTDGSEEVRYLSTYHPSGVDRKAAARLDIRSGADLSGIDIRLLRAPMVRISGIVTGIPGDLQPNSVGIETRADTMRGGAVMVGPDGRFEIWNLDPGKWLLTALMFRGGQARSAPLEVEVGTQHIDGLELRMVAPFDVAVQAVFEADSAKPRPQTANGPPPRLSLQEVNRLGGARGTRPMVLPEDGSFQFASVEPGRYRVNFSWRAGIKSIRLGTVEMENQILDLSNGTGGAPVSVVFGPATGELTGIVRDDKGPVAGASVVLRNPTISAGSTNGAYTATTGADGTYRFANLAAGEYLLVALDAGETNPISDTYDDYEDILVEVRIGTGERLNRDLRRHSGGR